MVNMIQKKKRKGMPSQRCSTQICDSSKEEKEREKELEKKDEEKNRVSTSHFHSI